MNMPTQDIAPTPTRPTHLRARFAKDASDAFFADVRRQVTAYLRRNGKSRYDDGRIALKGALYAAVTLGAYLLALFGGLPPWASFAAGVVFGLGCLLLGLNVGHDGALVVASPGNGTIRRYDLATGAGLGTFARS